MDVFALTMRLKEEGAAQVKASVDKLNRSFTEASGKAKAYDMTIGSLKNSFAGLASGMALGAVFSKVIQETSDAAAAAAQLNAVLKSTEGVAGQTKDALDRHAQALSYMTAYDDDAITSAQALLLTFTKIQGDVFPKATQAVLDMATAMGTDLKSAAIQIGKALNDPVLGVSALSRAGVQFNEQQKNMIALMVETNNVLGAQDIILAELRTQFEGSAKAAANTLGGAISQLNNELGNLLTLSSNNSSVATTFVQRLTDAIRGLNAVLSDLGISAPDVKQKLASLFREVAPFLPSVNALAFLIAKGARAREAAAGGKGFESAFTVPKGLQAFGEKGDGTGTPVARSIQIDQLLRLAEVTKLNASQQALLRSEATRLAAAMRAQNVSIEEQITLGGKLKAIRTTLEPYAGMPTIPKLDPALMQNIFAKQARLSVQAIPPALKTDLKMDKGVAMDALKGAQDFAKVVDDSFSQEFDYLRQRLEVDFGMTLADALATGIETAIQTGSIGAGFKALTQTLLRGLGDMMINFGKNALIAAKFMDGIFKALSNALPGGAIVASLAMIAAGAALKGAAGAAFGGRGGGGGGGGGYSLPFAAVSGIGGTSALPTVSYGPTMAGRGNTIQQTTPMNITVIGPNDPSAQRQMQELMRNAQRRGEA